MFAMYFMVCKAFLQSRFVMYAVPEMQPNSVPSLTQSRIPVPGDRSFCFPSLMVTLVNKIQ